MKRVFWRTGLALALSAALTSAARAAPGWSGHADMLPGSGVSIEYVSPLSQVPPNGCLPILITINNRSGRPRLYNFRLQTSDGYRPGASRQRTVFQSIRAENETETHTLALLPVVPSERDVRSYRPTSIQVTGYGVDTLGVGVSGPYRPSAQRTVFVGMSQEVYDYSWSPLESSISSHARTLWGSRIDLGSLPPDWRALTGLQCLWLTPSGYASLDAGQKAAVQDWICAGGVLYVYEATPDAATRAEFGLHDPAGHVVARGFGEVRWFLSDLTGSPPVDKIETAILSLDKFEAGLNQAADDWGMAPGVGKLRLNVPLLLGFIGLFAILVGPVNLFYFARSDRRHRLFWTTPAISLGASLLLIVIIILQDGFGGDGARVSLTYLWPAQNKAVTIQEQLSRTGVLVSRDFNVGSGALLSPVSLRTMYSQELQQNGNDYGGDWFVSRSLQAQRLSTIQPTRAKVQLLNADEAKAGAPPVVVSSLPVELEQLFLADEKGRFWRGKSVRTGEQQTLQPAAEFYRFDGSLGGSSRLETLRRTFLAQAGSNEQTQNGPCFYASAAHGPFIDTLRSVRWTHEQAVYVGPVTY